MITIEDIRNIDGVYESGFGGLNISKVFAFGMLDKWYIGDRCKSFKNFDERSLELAKEEGILDIPKLKPAKVGDKLVKAFYEELSRSSDTGEKFDKAWLGLTASYFNTDSPLVSGDVTGPKNSAFYCGQEMYYLKKAAKRAPAFSDCANNIITTFCEKADSQKITDEFKKTIASELVSPLIARSLNILYESNSINKNIIVRNPLSLATRFMEDYKIAKPPIYDNLKPVLEFLDRC